MKTRMLWLLGCVLALSSQAQTAKRELWVWKDANGVTQYSDRPAPGARRMTVAGSAPAATSQTAETPSPSASPGEGRSQGEGATNQPSLPYDVRYESLQVVTPAEEQTFFGADGVVPVEISSTPELASGDRMVIYLNGKPADAPENSYQATLNGVERGEHSLTVSIFGADGRPKIASAPRRFFVRATTIDNPRNVGPALRPNPTPRPAPTPAPRPPSSK